MRTAGFRALKTLDDSVWNANIVLPVGLTREYMEELRYLMPRENRIVLGAVGTGKIYLGTAIVLIACQQGRQVRFYTAAS